MIPFNKPHLFGNELNYIRDAVATGKISGDGVFTHKCHEFFQRRFSFKKTLLTSSCTDALEMIALLCRLQPGDEIIAPSFTFVSTVNPFVMQGAHIVFCDVKKEFPCIDEEKIAGLISTRTKAIIVMHYGGVACNMEPILSIAAKYRLIVIEDAAHAINAYYHDKPLGSLSTFAAFSFHETKNVMAGEGGMLVLNDESFSNRAEVIREKGTNRSQFFRGEVDKYNWIDVGSSFLPSELTAAFLFAQLEHIDIISDTRMKLWNTYYQTLLPLQQSCKFLLPVIPAYAKHNAHLFYLLLNNTEERDKLIQFLNKKGVMAIFHYQPLHDSPFWKSRSHSVTLPETNRYANTLLRLPLYFDLSVDEVYMICDYIKEFYARN